MGVRRLSVDLDRFVKLLEGVGGISNGGQNAAQIIMSFEVIGTYAHRALVVRYRLTIFDLEDKGVAQAISSLCIVRPDLHSFLVVRDRIIYFSLLPKSLSKGELCFGILRVDLQSLLKLRDRLVCLPLLQKSISEIAPGLHEVGLDL